jgi:hypothetical protein
MGLITDIIRKKIDEHAKSEEERKSNLAAGYLSAITEGFKAKTLTQEQLDEYRNQIDKLYGRNKGVKETTGRFSGLIGKFLGKPGAKPEGGAADQPGDKPSAQAPRQPPNGGAAAQVLPPPQQTAKPETAEATAPPAQPSAAAAPRLSPPGRVSMVPDWAKARGYEQEEEAAKHKYRIAEIDEQAKVRGDKALPTIIKSPGEDGKPHNWRQFQRSDGSHYMEDLGEVSAQVSGVPRVIGRVSVSLAKTLSKDGKQTYKDVEGNALDPSQFPDEMMLVNVKHGTNDYWVPLSQNQTHFAVGGMVYAVPSLEQVNLAKGAGVELAPSQIPSTSTRSQVAMGPTGQPVINVLPGSRTPQVTGIPGRPRTAPGAPSPVAQPTAPAGVRPSPTAQAVAPSAPAHPTTGSAGARVLGMPTGIYNQMLQRVTAVREANTQISGDPTQPEFKGLKDYGHLADDPASRARLGTALRMTFDGLDQGEKSSGSLMTLIKNTGGIPQAIAASQSRIMQDVIGKLTPEEKDAYDATMTTFSTMVGLRSLTKASAAMFSVKAIEREIPVIGVNTTSSRQFEDQLAHVAEIIYNGTRGVPEGMWDKQELERIKSGPSYHMQRKLKTAPSGSGAALPKPGKPGDKLSVEQASAYLRAAGGDKDKARQAAQKDGWTF